MKRKTDARIKTAAAAAFIALCLLLPSCSGSKKEADINAGSPPVQSTEAPGSTGTSDSPGEALRALLAPHEKLLSSARSGGCRYDGLMIPEQKLSEAAGHADTHAVSLTAGRYSFQVTVGGNHEYSVWGQDVLEGLATQEPYAEENTDADPEHMENVWSDTVSQGGGDFSYRYVYDISPDMKSGASEMTALLDGALSGHERFDWVFENGCLYFADAVLDGASMEEGSYPYITVRGVITADGFRITEHTDLCTVPGVPSSYRLPSAQNSGVFLAEETADAVLYAENGTVYETRNGTVRKYTLK